MRWSMFQHRTSVASATAMVMTARRAPGRALAGPQTRPSPGGASGPPVPRSGQIRRSGARPGACTCWDAAAEGGCRGRR